MSLIAAGIGAGIAGAGSIGSSIFGSKKAKKQQRELQKKADEANTMANATMANMNQIANRGPDNRTQNAVQPYLTEAKGAANLLTPVYESLLEMGGETYDHWLDNYSGVSTDYVNAALAINPESYRASAAADAQTSIANMDKQLDQALAAQGIDPSSERAMALKSSQKRYQAALSTGVKNQATRQGIKDRLEALGGVVKTGQGFLDTSIKATGAAGDTASAQSQIYSQLANVMVNAAGVDVNIWKTQLSNYATVLDYYNSKFNSYQSGANAKEAQIKNPWEIAMGGISTGASVFGSIASIGGGSGGGAASSGAGSIDTGSLLDTGLGGGGEFSSSLFSQFGG